MTFIPGLPRSDTLMGKMYGWYPIGTIQISMLPFLVTKNGINNTPVISGVGLIIQEPAGGNDSWNSARNGMIKISPDGRRIAWTSKGMHKIQVANFNTETGVITNPIIIMMNGLILLNSLKMEICCILLLVTPLVKIDTVHITQINLIAGTYAQIVNSAFRLDPYGPDYVSQTKVIQLGIDGKIYATNAASQNGCLGMV
jgi:hypothetical protein